MKLSNSFCETLGDDEVEEFIKLCDNALKIKADVGILKMKWFILADFEKYDEVVSSHMNYLKDICLFHSYGD